MTDDHRRAVQRMDRRLRQLCAWRSRPIGEFGPLALSFSRRLRPWAARKVRRDGRAGTYGVGFLFVALHFNWWHGPFKEPHP